MSLTADFFRIAQPLCVPSMGTEHVGPLLHTLVCLLRPVSVLEIGAGYTTLFLAQGLADAAAEADRDRQLLHSGNGDRATLLSLHAGTPYEPRLFVLDNRRHPQTSAGSVPEALRQLGIDQRVTFLEAGFAGASARLPASAKPLDFVWFDCGAAGENGEMFFREYWPLVKADGGVVVLHSMHVPLRTPGADRATLTVPSRVLNDLAKRQADQGRGRTFELVSLLEPHKLRQGDVTIIRKVGPLHAIRGGPAQNDGGSYGGGAERLTQP